MITDTKKHPITICTDLIPATLDGRKTQARRVIEPQPIIDIACPLAFKKYIDDKILPKCPYGKVGDRLWVRETWLGNKNDIVYKAGKPEDKNIVQTRTRSSSPRKTKVKDTSEYGKNLDLLFAKKISQKEFHKRTQPKWKSPIHMPRWASRITLEITDIRVERLLEISYGDILSEGRPINIPLGNAGETAGYWFINLWNSRAKKGFKWTDSPWVWVITFRRIK